MRCARDRGLLKARGRQRTDSTHVLAAVRALNRVELVTETMRHALTVLADVAPEWLRAHGGPSGSSATSGAPRIDRLPSKQAERQALAETIGRDGLAVLVAVDADEAPSWLRGLPALRVLRAVWIQNYLVTETGVRWRTDEDGLPPAALFISSPYDADAHYARKHTTSWVGYKVHLTETCEDDTPNLITHVETTPGPVADGAVTPDIHQELAERDLLPGMHVVDTGYLDAELLVTTPAQYGVDLLGPTRKDYHWQARDGTGLRRPRVHDRLGRRAGHLPCGADQHQLDAGRGQASQPGHQDQVLDEGLRPLPPSSPVHPFTQGIATPNHHRASRRISTRRCGRHGNGSRPTPTPRSTPDAPASKARSRRPCVAADCVARATSAWPGPTWATS